MENFKALVGAIRNIRGELSIPPGQECDVRFRTKSAEQVALVERYFSDICFLTKTLPQLQAAPNLQVPAASSHAVVGEIEVVLVWTGDVKERELSRLGKSVQKLEGAFQGVKKKLSNEKFTSKAPAEVVERERERMAQLESELGSLKAKLEQLS